MSGASTTPLQLDDNLVNGQTYTFQFQCQNWFCLTDLSQALAGDITQNAPNFLTSVQVTSPPTTSLYNVQFTYEGDGSDVVSDLAQSLIAAFQSGSGDSLSFIGSVQASAAAVTVTPSQAVDVTAQAVQSGANAVIAGTTQVVGSAATGITSAAGGVVNTGLTSLLPLLAVVVLLILFVLPSFTKSARELNPV